MLIIPTTSNLIPGPGPNIFRVCICGMLRRLDKVSAKGGGGNTAGGCECEVDRCPVDCHISILLSLMVICMCRIPLTTIASHSTLAPGVATASISGAEECKDSVHLDRRQPESGFSVRRARA